MFKKILLPFFIIISLMGCSKDVVKDNGTIQLFNGENLDG